MKKKIDLSTLGIGQLRKAKKGLEMLHGSMFGGAITNESAKRRIAEIDRLIALKKRK